MKERIRKIMEHEQLTSSLFADKVGVSKSTISNIFSARNNPSLEMVYAILNAFPFLKLEWVLYGTGEMIHEEKSQDPSFDKKLSEFPNLFENIGEIAPEGIHSPEYRKEIGVNGVGNHPKPTEIERIVYKETPPKAIAKIMIFYSDNTFDTFVLEKK